MALNADYLTDVMIMLLIYFSNNQVLPIITQGYYGLMPA